MTTLEPLADELPELLSTLDFMDYKIYMHTCLVPTCTYDPNRQQSLRAKSFRNYKGGLGAILELQKRWQDMKEIGRVDARFTGLRESLSDFYHTEFPHYVAKFHADNVFWEQRELARLSPDTYMPADVIAVRRSSRLKERNRPIVHNGKMYTSGLYHFLNMWGSGHYDRVTEEDMDPRAVDMLIAAEAVNESADPVRLVPFQILPSGELLLGDLETNAFLRAVDCMWMTKYV